MSDKAKILGELKQDFESVAEEYMYFYGVTRKEFALLAVEVANEMVFNDERDDEPEVELSGLPERLNTLVSEIRKIHNEEKRLK